MKNFSVICLGMFLLTLMSCSKGYVIQGELEGASDGTKIALLPFAKYDTKPEQETTIENGQFSFSGEVPEPRLYYLMWGNNQANYRIMVENSKISFHGNLNEKKNGERLDYSFDNVSVIGSASNDYFHEQMKVKDELSKLFEEKNRRFGDIQVLYAKARTAKDQSMMDSVKALPRYAEYVDAEKAFFTEVEKRYNEVFEANKDTYWGPLMMLNLYAYMTPDTRPVFEGMSDEAKESYYGKMVAEDLYPANRTGERVPDFTTADENGTQHTLNELIKDKKVVLIDFWASWCVPCRKELPNVKANYEKFASKGFDVISISIDKNAEAWKKAVAEEGLEWPNFNDLDVASLYKVQAVPTTYLIDNEGHLLAENVRGEDLGKKLEEILGN
ncbi:TlpA disulfide reductase family protein [Mangrovibacterium lignilyticum]|uniref:TlpA disulfide reductase family protein n=1 Tax=Mangrovibacterium lignilyticum TaxID=2668052 RepID=UPI0013D2933E|nr:TlpA disulfide reductase family protein [Mangrovibacterium lignilyticum]